MSKTEQDAFKDLIRKNLPEDMEYIDIVHACGIVMTAYLDANQALECLKRLTLALEDFYTSYTETCPCPKCVALREDKIH